MNNKKVFYICMIIWIAITLLRLAFHQPWYDESHAYVLAQNFTIPEIIAEMKYEGHLLLWYLLIMPFAKLKLWYPYPMQVMNWIFAFLALIIMWKKAPFNPITKAVITFSSPFMTFLPIIARCYAVGILLFMLILSLNNKSLKHPIWYSILILLCSNSSAMALFAITPIGMLFVYDLIKGGLNGIVSKKDFRISISILSIAAFLIILSIFSAAGNSVSSDYTFAQNLSYFLFGYDNKTSVLYKVTCYVIMTLTWIYTTVIMWLKNKRALFVWYFPLGCLLYCLTCKYSGYFHHCMYFWIYTIFAYWLLLNSLKNNKILNRITQIVFICFFAITFFTKETDNYYVYNIHSRDMYKTLKSNVEENARIILMSTFAETCLPYAENDNFEFWDYAQNKNALQTSLIYHPTKTESNYSRISPMWLTRSLAKDRPNYVILQTIQGFENKPFQIVFNLKNSKMKLIPITEFKYIGVLYKVIIEE